jgi:glutathione S-transferase
MLDPSEAGMSNLTLLIGNKNYSSWSLRPWLALRQAGLAFREELVPLYVPGSSETLARLSPTGRVPVLRIGELVIHESLAICEAAAELAPNARLWPTDFGVRAIARAVSCEMHAGFASLRHGMPMNVRGRARQPRPIPVTVQTEIARIEQIWRECRERHGAGGSFLFGHFSIADAMFAPVVTRFRSYGVTLAPISQAYCDAVEALPAMQEWTRDARAETACMSETDALLD